MASAAYSGRASCARVAAPLPLERCSLCGCGISVMPGFLSPKPYRGMRKSPHRQAPFAFAGARPARRLLLPMLAAVCLAVLLLGVIAGMWWKGRSEPAGVWTGVYLGGPELSTIPRPSPDGHLLAFVAKDNDDAMQVWVMNRESGNRVMLTHRRDLGFASICS